MHYLFVPFDISVSSSLICKLWWLNYVIDHFLLLMYRFQCSWLFLTYHLGPFSSDQMVSDTLCNPIPLLCLPTYNLLTSLFGCSAPFIVIIFCVCLISFSSSFFVYFTIPAIYLIAATFQIFIAEMPFLLFRFDFNSSLILRYIPSWISLSFPFPLFHLVLLYPSTYNPLRWHFHLLCIW